MNDNRQSDAQPLAPWGGWRRWLYEIIFETETPTGKAFDVLLILFIATSVLVVILDSMAEVREQYRLLLNVLEWCFTLLFTVEYVLRLLCAPRPNVYASSFFGVIDLLGILPTYIGMFVPGSHYLLAIRLLRVLRIFRVLKLVLFMSETRFLSQSLYASWRKIAVFLFVVLNLAVVTGSLMYVIEGRTNGGPGGFSNIPQSIYWAIVTLTTVGYGDISPVTALGKAVASMLMIMGYGIIAVPTGIVTAEIIRPCHGVWTCPSCQVKEHDADAKHCKYCGARLHEP